MELSKVISVSVPDNHFEGMQLTFPGFRPFQFEFMGKQYPSENVRLWTEIIFPERFTFNTLELVLKSSIREKIAFLEADQAS